MFSDMAGDNMILRCFALHTSQLRLPQQQQQPPAACVFHTRQYGCRQNEIQRNYIHANPIIIRPYCTIRFFVVVVVFAHSTNRIPSNNTNNTNKWNEKKSVGRGAEEINNNKKCSNYHVVCDGMYAVANDRGDEEESGMHIR